MVRDGDTDRCVSVCCVLVTDKGAVIGGLQRGTRRGKITSGLSDNPRNSMYASLSPHHCSIAPMILYCVFPSSISTISHNGLIPFRRSYV